MTSLPPENAPQLGTCPKCGGKHKFAAHDDALAQSTAACWHSWHWIKPVAAPENQSELCVSCGGTKENPKTRLAGCSDDLCWSKFHEPENRPRPIQLANSRFPESYMGARPVGGAQGGAPPTPAEWNRITDGLTELSRAMDVKWEYFSLPLEFREPKTDSEGAMLYGADGQQVAMLFWPLHPPEETEAAEQETYRLGRILAGRTCPACGSSQKETWLLYPCKHPWHKSGVDPGAHPPPDPETRFAEFDDEDHPFRKWWQEHGQFMMSGGGRRESIWAARGWIAREQLGFGAEVTGDSMRERARAPQSASSECGEPVCHLIAGASWFACALPKGHKEEGHRAGGNCFKHGPYVMNQAGVPPQCPKWPDCIKGEESSEKGTSDGTSTTPTESTRCADVDSDRTVAGDIGKAPVASSKLSAQEFYPKWAQVVFGYCAGRVLPGAYLLQFAEAYAREYASSSNSALERMRITAQLWKGRAEALEGQLREAQSEAKVGRAAAKLLLTSDTARAKAEAQVRALNGTVERLQEALRVETRKAEALLKLGAGRS